MFACLYVPPLASSPAEHEAVQPASGRSDLASLAREFSPRVEVHGPGLVTLDITGLERLFGDANQLGDELRRATADRRLPARIVIASTRTTAWLLAHARAGLTVVRAGDEPRWLAPLPLRVLEQLAANGLGPCGIRLQADFEIRLKPDPTGAFGVTSRAGSSKDTAAQAASLVALLKRWGVTTLGEFARLPATALSERLGQQGLAWQRLARGEEVGPLVPAGPEERFEETLDLEWPIEGLQPLSFVFGRLFDQLSAHLVARDRAAAALHIHLQLVTRQVERRSLQLPAPMREARVLRTLALLNLEAHPVTAGIDRVTVIADPVPGRVIQWSLLTRALPLPEQMSTLIARLGALMGEERCGLAALVDSHRPGAFEMRPVRVADWDKAAGRRQTGRRTVGAELARPETQDAASSGPRAAGLAIRRFRIPVPASVATKDGRPVRIVVDRPGLRGGCVRTSAGPWRTSGEWWRVSEARMQLAAPPAPSPQPPAVAWNRDEWDVNLADGGVYRIYRDRDRDRWFVDGVVD